MTALVEAGAAEGPKPLAKDEPCEKQSMRDALLSQLVQKTGAETSLALDLLQAHSWDIQAALQAFQALQERSSSPSKTNGTAAGDEDGETSVPGQAVLTLCHHNKEEAEAEEESKDGDSDSLGDASESGGSKLSRGFSKATENSKVMWNARAHVWKGLNGWHLETPSYTFTLPDLGAFPDSFRRFLEKDLIETSTLRALENSGHLNWWSPAPKLWPLATSGDGNCLLHSASLGMWGFHDRLLILRKALFDILARGGRRHALWRRWRWDQTQANKASGLVYSEAEWRREWDALVRLASPQPRSKAPPPSPPLPNTPSQTPADPPSTQPSEPPSDRVWESLEEIHVFALAHVLKRPVIVVADTVLRDSGGEAFAPIPFGGIYLPLECPPSECHRSPLVLSYDAAHFSALVLMHGKPSGTAASAAAGPWWEGAGCPVVPVTTDKPRRLLPLHFAADPGPDFTWWTDEADDRIARNTHLSEERRLALVQRYLDLVPYPNRRPSSFRPPSNPVSPSLAQRQSKAATLPAVSSPPSATSAPADKTERRKSRKLSLSRLASSLRKKMSRRESSGSSASSLRRRLSFKSSRGGAEGRKERGRSLSGRSHSGSPRPQQPLVSASDIRDSHQIIGARLNTSAQHQYMSEMVENYLKAARVRFDEEQKRLAGLGAGGGAGGRAGGAGTLGGPERGRRERERISRSFSASSLPDGTCMNGACEASASAATNFLCVACFASQREMMASFSNPGPAQPPRGPPKSATLPAMASAASPTAAPASTGYRRTLGPNGVTRYLPPAVVPAEPTHFCRRPHCQHYSNGHPALCPPCAKAKP